MNSPAGMNTISMPLLLWTISFASRTSCRSQNRPVLCTETTGSLPAAGSTVVRIGASSPGGGFEITLSCTVATAGCWARASALISSAFAFSAGTREIQSLSPSGAAKESL